LPYEKVVRWQDGSAVALVMPDGSAFGIWKEGKKGLFRGRGGQHLHFAFQITPDEYDTFTKRLRALNVAFDEHNWPNGHRSIYFFDPDGHQGEFMTCDWLAL
jgi:catechol 2,3-dioxygenase-like lactoylglutathione lyase family enzyme